MKKLSQRTAAVLVAVPLMLTGAAALSAPAHASNSTACEYQPPPTPSDPGSSSERATGTPTTIVYECNRYVPPPAYAPLAPPALDNRGVEASARTAAYSPMAEYYRIQAEAFRQHARRVAVFTVVFSSVCVAALGIIVLRNRKTKTTR